MCLELRSGESCSGVFFVGLRLMKSFTIKYSLQISSSVILLGLFLFIPLIGINITEGHAWGVIIGFISLMVLYVLCIILLLLDFKFDLKIIFYSVLILLLTFLIALSIYCV